MPLPRVRLTVRRMMVAVIVLGFGLSAARWWAYNFATIYAPGYTEAQFRSCPKVIAGRLTSE
jgi:hypothetical protein